MSPSKEKKLISKFRKNSKGHHAQPASLTDATPQKNGRIIPIRPTDFKRELDGRNLNLLKMQSKESKNSGRRIDVRELVLARLAYAAESVESLFLATRLREDARSLSGRSVEAE